MKKNSKDKILHYKYGIYAGLVIFGISFITGIIFGLLNHSDLLVSIISVSLGIILWFVIGFKALDKLRTLCKRLNPFRMLISMWVTVISLDVLLRVVINFIFQQPLTQDVNGGFSFIGIFMALIVEYSYKKSRRKLKRI